MRGNNLGLDSMKGLVIRLAIPSMIAQFINVFYSIVDRIFVGNILEIGGVALAGVGICGPIVTLISSFSTWIGIGGSPLMSIAMGERNQKRARHIMANCFVMLIIMALIITSIILIFKDKLLMFFGASDVTFQYADTYMSIYAIGSIFSIVALGMNSFIICQGFSRVAMFTVVIGAVANIILDPIFIFVLDMGVAGASLATVLSQMLSFIFVLWFLFSKYPKIRITFRGYSFDIMKKVLLIGFSPFIIISLDSGLIIAMNMALQYYGGANYGDQLVTCHTIAQSFFLMVTLPLGGITGSTQPILGFNYGSGDIKRVKDGQKYTLIVCLVFTAIMMIIANLFSQYFVRLFTSDEVYMALSVKAIKIFTLMVIPLAVQYTIVDGFTGISAVRYAISLSCFRKALYFGAMIVFPLMFGIENIFYAEPVVDVISVIVSSFVYFKVMNNILEKRRNMIDFKGEKV